MKPKHVSLLVVLLLSVIVFFVHIKFSSTVEGYTYDSYKTFIDVEHIQKTGVPAFEDEFTVGSIRVFYQPLFQYLLAGLTYVFSFDDVMYFLPSVIIALTFIILYSLLNSLVRSRPIAIVVALFTTFHPLWFVMFAKNLIPTLLFVPLLLLFIYVYVNIDEGKAWMFVVLLFLVLLMGLTSALSLILIPAILFYLFLMRLDSMVPEGWENEVGLFIIFFFVWFFFIVHKQALATSGLKIFWQNLPFVLLNQTFKTLSFAEVLATIGILPIALGLYSFYSILIDKKRKSHFILLGFFISIVLAIVFRVVPFFTGILSLAIVLLLLSPNSIYLMQTYVRKTRASYLSKAVVPLLVLIFLVTTIGNFVTTTESHVENIVSDSYIQDISRLKDEGISVIIASPREGHVINFVAGKKNLLDTQFTNVPDAVARFEDIRFIYRSSLETSSVSRMHQYGADAIILSERSKQLFGISEPLFVHPDGCFKRVEGIDLEVYRLECRQ
ncbi:hypothetical protein JW868_01795 [Candidatus Woesearchaeota archaeon]|nr:hypothetical protein [Candidatus Woesearchaeota archaeon]